MGYRMSVMECNFALKKENHADALEAIKSLAGKETIHDSSGGHFSWVDTKDFLDARHIENALEAWRWEAEFDPDGNINRLCFVGEKLGDCELVFNAIAPYVEENSYIQMLGEDGFQWRWVFSKDGVREVAGETTFPES